MLKRTRTYREVEDLPEGSVILAGGLAFQCAGIQDQKKVWQAPGVTGGFTTGSILDTVRKEKFDLKILHREIVE